MNYNDGNVHTEIFEQSTERQQEIAKDFSEGNKLLEKTLLELWKKNIKTIACCNGHEEKEARFYISLAIDDNSTSLASEIVDYIYKSDSSSSYINFRKMKGYLTETIYLDIKDRDSFLLSINSILKETNEIHKKNDVIKKAKLFDDFTKNYNLNFNYSIDKDKSMFNLTKEVSVLLFGNEKVQLKNYIDKMKETGDIPLKVPFECDDETLNEFFNIIYPNEKLINENDENINYNK